MLEGKLNIFYGDTIEIIKEFYHKLKFSHLAINLDITPFGITRNKKIQNWCKKTGVDYISKVDYSLLDLNKIKNGSGGYYKTFSHFNTKVIDLGEEIIKKIRHEPNLNYHKISGVKGDISIKKIDSLK